MQHALGLTPLVPAPVTVAASPLSKRKHATGMEPVAKRASKGGGTNKDGTKKSARPARRAAATRQHRPPLSPAACAARPPSFSRLSWGA